VGEYLRVDLTIVRGLAYYTGIVFELFDAQGEFRAICGGGRYDNLLQALGGVDLPALGFGMGDVVLGELLRARGKLMPMCGTPVPTCGWCRRIDPDRARARGCGVLAAADVSVEYAQRGEAARAQERGAAQGRTEGRRTVAARLPR
jgi:histidyl-tRNA synthetase